MMNFTGELASESVSRGHPDKLADQISDAVLDACLRVDPRAKVACECLVKDKHVVLAGEIGSRVIENIDQINCQQLVRKVLDEVGYNAAVFGSDQEAVKYAGISAGEFELSNLLGKQSEDIRSSVEKQGGAIGAGDQGFVYGYACEETPALMPAPIYYCQQMMRRYHELVQERGERSDWQNWPRPDAKCQLTLRYEDGRPVEIANVTVSAQHAPVSSDSERDRIRGDIIEHIIRPVLRDVLSQGISINQELASQLENPGDDNRIQPRGRRLFVNPSEEFVTGGPKGDAGLTGRKIIVDTYGGLAHHGGGAFSGKDSTKVDRSAAYMARHIAKNLVKAGWCGRCEVMIGYVIGIEEPVALHANPLDHKTSAAELTAKAREIWNKSGSGLTPEKIIERLDLRRPIFSSTARYGHFGQDELEHSWEKTTDIATQSAG